MNKYLPPYIINMTQHRSTPEQSKAGVIDGYIDINLRQYLLTFTELPDYAELTARAACIAKHCYHAVKQMQIDAFLTLVDYDGKERFNPKYAHVMIGGAPYFMPYLEKALREKGLVPVYSFSERVSRDSVPDKDGKVTKITEFKHTGFIW